MIEEPALSEDDRDFGAWADAWVASQEPDRVQRLIEEERAHVSAFNRELGRFAVQFEAVYSAYLRLLDDINFVAKGGWPAHRSVQYVLLSYNSKTFYSAFDRLHRGYYEDAITLTRGLYETFVRAIWISAHPAHAYNVLVHQPPEGPRFNLTNFLRDQLGLDWSSNYSTLSAFAHSNGGLALQALVRAAEREGDPERFDAQVTYKSDLAVVGAALLTFTLLTHVRFAVDRLMEGVEPRSEETFQAAVDAKAFLTQMLVTNPKPYWQKVASDLDMLFEMLVVADRGGDWRDWLANRIADAADPSNTAPGRP